MKQHIQRTAAATTNRTDGTERRAYVPPRLEARDKLPVITAGSISKEMWQFDDGESAPP